MTEVSSQRLPRKGRARAGEPPILWDPLVRISHWGIAVVVLANYALNKSGGWIHVTLGWVGLTLLLLRLLWGVVGTKEARFSAFPPQPMAALRHLVSLAKGRPAHYGSHNPAGAIMVYALWAMLAVITFSGLVLTDFRTPMQQAKIETIVSTGDWSTLASTSGDEDENEDGAMGVIKEVHEIAANLVLLLVLLHVAGVVIEGRAMRRNLVKPMLFGSPPKGPKA